MRELCNGTIQDKYLGGEILQSSSKCRSWTSTVLFAGAEKIGCQWKVNFILTFVYPSGSQECCCCGASSSNMFVITEPGQSIQFEHYLGINKKETVERSYENFELCDRFFPVKYIKFLQIETDHIQYEICFI